MMRCGYDLTGLLLWLSHRDLSPADLEKWEMPCWDELPLVRSRYERLMAEGSLDLAEWSGEAPCWEELPLVPQPLRAPDGGGEP
jgi:hypothetical protein